MSTALPHPPPTRLRRTAQQLLRAALGVARRGPFRRHLRRLRYGPWAPRVIGGLTVESWRGALVAVDPGEAHGFHVFVHGDYGGAETDACVEACREAAGFVDVGAHIGLMTLAVAKARPDVRIVAVEADARIAAWLRHNLSLNPDVSPRVTVLEAAASDHDGLVTFAASAIDGNVGMGHVSAAGGQAVPAVALGPWLSARGIPADVVKMDVEGGELEALAGLWLGPAPRTLLLETHGYMAPSEPAFNARLFEALSGRGYVIERLSRGRWHPVRSGADIGGRDHLRASAPR